MMSNGLTSIKERETGVKLYFNAYKGEIYKYGIKKGEWDKIQQMNPPRPCKTSARATINKEYQTRGKGYTKQSPKIQNKTSTRVEAEGSALDAKSSP